MCIVHCRSNMYRLKENYSDFYPHLGTFLLGVPYDEGKHLSRKVWQLNRNAFQC